MMYPDDIDSINEDIEFFRFRSKSNFLDTRLGQHLTEDFRSSAKTGGLIAGAVLYKMAIFRHYNSVSYNKTTFLVEQEMQRSAPLAKRNISTIKKAFDRFKNSSHLWAAMLASGEQLSPGNPIDFLRLLQIADQLYEMTKSIVKKWDPWIVPPGLPPAHYDPGGPDDDDLRRIKGYRAPRTST